MSNHVGLHNRVSRTHWRCSVPPLIHWSNPGDFRGRDHLFTILPQHFLRHNSRGPRPFLNPNFKGTLCVPHMFAGEQRPGSPGSPRNGSGSAEDDDDDDYVASHHNSEGHNEEDDNALDDDADDADDGNPLQGTRRWTLAPCSSVDATPPIGPPSTSWNAALPTGCPFQLRVSVPFDQVTALENYLRVNPHVDPADQSFDRNIYS